MEYGWDRLRLIRNKNYYFRKVLSIYNEYDIKKEQDFAKASAYYNSLLMDLKNDDIDKESYLSASEIFDTIKEESIYNNSSDLSLEISKLLLPDNYIKLRKMDDISLNDREAIDIAHNIIKEKLNNKHLKIFDDIFTNRCDKVYFSNSNTSYSIYNKSLNDSHILIEKSNTLNKVIDIIHEAGHNYSNHIKNVDIYGTIVSEVESLFYELIGYSYFYENNLYKNDSLICMSSLFKYMDDFALFNTYIDINKIDNLNDFKKVSRMNDLYRKTNSHTTNYLLDRYYHLVTGNGFMYVYSYLIALELFDIYKKDKEYGIKCYDNFVKGFDTCYSDDFIKKIDKRYGTFNDCSKYKKERDKVLKLIKKGDSLNE